MVVLLNSLRSGPTFVPETENGDKNGDGKIYFIYSKKKEEEENYLFLLVFILNEPKCLIQMVIGW